MQNVRKKFNQCVHKLKFTFGRVRGETCRNKTTNCKFCLLLLSEWKNFDDKKNILIAMEIHTKSNKKPI